MKIARFSTPDITQAIGLVLDEGLLNFTEAHQAKSLMDEGVCCCPVHTPMELMEAGLFTPETFREVLAFVREHNLLRRFLISDCGFRIGERECGDVRLLAPIARPSKILAMGRNYVAHAKELGHEVPTEPVYFGKLNSCVIGPGDSVVYKNGLTRVDYEVELAVVIGRECSNVPAERALDYVAGYTIVNDVTARDMQTEDFKTANPWTRSKGVDTFCPMGPWIVTSEEIGDPHALNLEMRVNGQVKQRDTTANMLFDIPRIIEAMSRLHTLYPGDVIPTGTPEGIGPVSPGDVMECEVEKIGILRNPVIAE